MLRSRLALANITRTNLELFGVTTQLSTGKAILRPSDDAVKAAAIAAVRTRAERTEQVQRNIGVAETSLATLDQALGEASDLLRQARSIASEQASFGSSAGERKSQAVVVQSIIDGLFRVANTESRVGHVFGGSTPTRQPMAAFMGGYRYVGEGPGLSTDLGMVGGVPVTLGGTTLLGATSSRVEGTAVLRPELDASTRVSDLDGARGLGVSPGVLSFALGDNPSGSADLTGVETIADVAARLNAALLAYESEHELTLLGPGGVSYEGDALTIDIAGDAGAGLVFTDTGETTTALDLGLADEGGGVVFDAANSRGLGVGPRLTWSTGISALRSEGESLTLGAIRLRAQGVVRVVDLAGAETLGQIRNRILGAGLGLRVEINEQGTGINVLSEVASGADAALSIEEINGNNGTAGALGIRTLGEGTRLADFNDGRGVRIVSGAVDPDTGDPDPARDIDLAITLGNGQTLEINFAPGDTSTVAALLEAINRQADDQLVAAGLDPDIFTAGLPTDGNGIALAQDPDAPGMNGPITIEPRNNSQAAADLGLLDGARFNDGNTLVGEDRARVRAPGVFSWLIDLRDALENDDTAGIAIAGERIGAAIDSVVETRALVGGYSNRVSQEATSLEDRSVLDAKLLSELEDADFAQAATRLSLLQSQLQASLQTTATVGRLSLLNFL